MYDLPAIEGVNRLCDRCLIGKKKRTHFLSQTSYRTGEPLELVHDNLFLLLVDDKSRFMWLILLQAKSEAAEAIKHI